jgi:hypothetical protein
MPTTELAFEVSAQEMIDPNGQPDSIEFDDLDTILEPALPSANEASAELSAEPELELELEADDIDALLGASGQLKV